MEIKIGKVLSRLMKEKRLGLRELARESKVSASTLSEWIGNRRPKDPAQVARVAAVLGVSLHYLLFEIEDPMQRFDLNRVLKDDVFSGAFEITLKRVRA